MNQQPTLLEQICPVRSRGIRPAISGRYLVREQMQEFDIHGTLLPNEIRASDGNTDGTKLTDIKGQEAVPG